MLKRNFSLKGKRNFRYLLGQGKSFSTYHFIVKYDIFEESGKYFGVIASNKFSKRGVIKNKAKRLILEAIRGEVQSFPYGRYVVIPKKNFLNDSGKINVDVKTVRSEINTFLSKMVVV